MTLRNTLYFEQFKKDSFQFSCKTLKKDTTMSIKKVDYGIFLKVFKMKNG